jgi:hypothetical protein
MGVTDGHRQATDGATEVSVRVEGDADRFYALAARCSVWPCAAPSPAT